MNPKYLYICGVLSAVVFTSTAILGGLLRPGYSHIADTISELFSPGSPNKLLLDTLHTISAALSTLFGIGVLLFVHGSGYSEPVGIMGAALIILTGLVNIMTATVFCLHIEWPNQAASKLKNLAHVPAHSGPTQALSSGFL